MQVKPVKLKDFARVLREDMAKLRRNVDLAVGQTAAEGRVVVEANAPEAFGDLKEGVASEVTSTGYRIISTAPHSAAVEVGSRPHTPPFAPIYAWVKLRGFQGIQSTVARNLRGAKIGRIKRHRAATFVASRIREQGIDHIDGDTGKRTRNAETPADAAKKVAWMIIGKIRREGTKPTWFVRRSLHTVKVILNSRIRAALERPL